ncbi:MAG: 6-phosphogluconolactonase [Anaerolineae bacterium]|nr:6-phosphogluconolactonase [Anaerolineae bacterium]
MSLHVFAIQDELSDAIANYVQHLSAQAIDDHGQFTVALSGGSLIKVLSDELTKDHIRSEINWSAWHVFWADERCVPLDHKDSNYGLAKELLFDQVDIPSEQIYTISPKLRPGAAARAYERTVRTILPPDENRLPRFDLMLLGMGEDGHTASLFPDHHLLDETRLWVAPIVDSPKPPSMRITLTLPVINNASYIAFVTTGAGKADAVFQAIEKSGSTSPVPAGRVQPTHGQLDWFLDEAAAARLIG